MARTLNSIAVNSPTGTITPAIDETFSFQGTPGFSGTGGVNRYDFKWEVNSGGGYVTIGAASGLTTADTNPITNQNGTGAASITVAATEAGSYTIRMVGAPATGGSYTVISAERTVTVSAAPDALLANDVASASSVTSPAIGQVHAILANDAASASSVGAPAIGQVHVLAAADVGSASTVGNPALAEGAAPDALLAEDVSSGSSVSSPAIGQVHALLAADVASGSSVTAPSIAQIHALLASGLASGSAISLPGIGQVHALLAAGASSGTSVSMPALGENAVGGVDDLHGRSVSAATGVTRPVPREWRRPEGSIVKVSDVVVPVRY